MTAENCQNGEQMDNRQIGWFQTFFPKKLKKNTEIFNSKMAIFMHFMKPRNIVLSHFQLLNVLKNP